MTKLLRKTSMRQKELGKKCKKYGTIENNTKYKKQNNYCKGLYKKNKKSFTII